MFPSEPTTSTHGTLLPNYLEKPYSPPIPLPFFFFFFLATKLASSNGSNGFELNKTIVT
jgi:hypothetical protein